MKFEPTSAELKSHDPKDVAKFIWNYFLFQHDIAIKNEIEFRCDYDAAVAANRAAEIEYSHSNELGWGPSLPYNENALNYRKSQWERALKDKADSNTLLNFIRDRFVDKFI